jgi:hypothetical protein
VPLDGRPVRIEQWQLQREVCVDAGIQMCVCVCLCVCVCVTWVDAGIQIEARCADERILRHAVPIHHAQQHLLARAVLGEFKGFAERRVVVVFTRLSLLNQFPQGRQHIGVTLAQTVFFCFV